MTTNKIHSRATMLRQPRLITVAAVAVIALSVIYSIHVVDVDAFSAEAPPSRVFLSTPTKANPRYVKDCMTPNPITLRTTDTVDEAINVLLSTGFNGAPVIDPVTKNLVGVVSAFDFLSKAETGVVLPFLATANEQEQAEMVRVARKIVATTVGDLMAPAAITVSPETSIREAADIMLRDKCHRLCVVDDDYNLVGVLATSDVMRNVISALRALPSVSTKTIDTQSESLPAESNELTP